MKRAARVGAIALLMAAAPAPVQAYAECRTHSDALGWYVPDHAKVQTGGYLGLFTVAAGYSAIDLLDFDVCYGWVPGSIGGTDIHSLALRVGAHVAVMCFAPDLSWTYLTGAVGAVMTFGDVFFLTTPNRYPDGYYAETAVRGILTLGGEIEAHQPAGSPFALHALFVEVSVLDEYLLVWLKNPREAAPWEVWSFSFGYKAGF